LDGPGANRGGKFGPFGSIFIASGRHSWISGPATELGSFQRRGAERFALTVSPMIDMTEAF
jgi:hypothetical protein